MEHHGPERRRRTVYVTRNTEYHLQDDVCVAIRDRRSQALRIDRRPGAIRLEGSVKVYSNGARLIDPEPIRVGGTICFTCVGEGGEEKHLVTSPIEAIDRPSKSDVELYTAKRDP